MKSEIQSALLIPTEQPPTLRDLKLALITFDRVHIPEPSDRDVIPRDALAFAMTGIPLFAMDMGPVMELGKSDDYDIVFEKVITEARDATTAGRLVVDASIQPVPGTLTIGAVQTAEGTPNPVALLNLFRHIAAQDRFLNAAISGAGFSQKTVGQLESLIKPGMRSISSMPDIGRVASIDEAIGEQLRWIAAARVATATRHLISCDGRGLQALTSDPGLTSIIRLLQESLEPARTILDDEASRLKLTLLKRLHEVVVKQYVNDSVLDAITVRDVLQLRTSAWGKAQESRTRMLTTIDTIWSDAAQNDKDFEVACQAAFDEYFKASSEFRHEAGKFDIKLTLTAAGTMFAGAKIEMGELVHSVSGVPAGVLMALAALGVAAASQLVDSVSDIRKALKELRASHGYALAAPYGRALKGRK